MLIFKTNLGYVALMYSININNLEIVRELIKAGADINIKQGKNKFCCLILAISLNNVEIVRELIKAGADLNIQDEYRINSSNACQYS